jgi:hypothetical protein
MMKPYHYCLHWQSGDLGCFALAIQHGTDCIISLLSDSREFNGACIASRTPRQRALVKYNSRSR